MTWLRLRRASASALLVFLLAVACGGGAASEGDATDGSEHGHGAGPSPSAPATVVNGHEDLGGAHGIEEHDAEGQAFPLVPGAPQVEVTAADIDFRPESLELAAGQAVNLRFANEGAILHDFTLEEIGLHVNAEPGEVVESGLQIDRPGTYEAICTVDGHAEAGMRVSIVVR